jgi:cell wall assembly regulator SMI1
MKPELQLELERLKFILESKQLKFSLDKGTTEETIAQVETKVGIHFDENLKDLWLLTNGSNYETWFAVFSDELTPCSFPQIEDALKSWSWLEPYDKEIYEEWSDVDNERDSRIQPAFLHHQLWFPFAEFNGYSTSIYFDANPTESGKYGQIIVYQHDPDAIYYVAEDFLSFFKHSNDLLEANLEELLL